MHDQASANWVNPRFPSTVSAGLLLPTDRRLKQQRNSQHWLVLRHNAFANDWCGLPQPSDWTSTASGIPPNTRNWQKFFLGGHSAQNQRPHIDVHGANRETNFMVQAANYSNTGNIEAATGEVAKQGGINFDASYHDRPIKNLCWTSPVCTRSTHDNRVPMVDFTAGFWTRRRTPRRLIAGTGS